MPPPLTLAIIGLGRWGTHLLRNFLALPQAEVIAIADIRSLQLQTIQNRFKLSPTVQCLETGEAALALQGLDAVAIATPAVTHDRLIRLALERGLHVLCEKPMTLDSAVGADLCRLATVQQRQLVVDHTYLFHPAVQRGYQFCQHQLAGAWRYGYATRTNLGPVRQDVDVFWDLAIHDVSILNYWLGQSPLAVAAWGQAWLQPQARSGFPDGLRDLGWVRLTYGAQVEVMIHVSWLDPHKQRRLALGGDQGTLVLDDLAPDRSLTWYPGQGLPRPPGWMSTRQKPQVIEVAAIEPLAQMAQHFLDCALANTPSWVSSGNVAMGLVQLMEAVQEAATTGQKIDLTP
jgi:predicted dehydrogenase